VHVTLTVLCPLIGGELGVISPRPKSKTCTLIWHSAGRVGQFAGGLALVDGGRTTWAHAGSESSAQQAASTKRVIGT
jgi:hypothetical protein